MIYRIIIQIVLLLCICFGACAYGYDDGDFAVSVESYDSTGVGETHNNPNVAIGRPSVDTLYYADERPVVPLFAASGSHQIVTVGFGGHLVLKFDHRVSDDENNPHGVDFIVFGNAWQMIGFEQKWHYGDPKQAMVATDIVFNEPGMVSVSQDGETWYSYDWSVDPNAPAADDFAPTLGRVFDESDPYDGYDGWENLWWGDKTDPTVPLDPNITASDFKGKSLAEVCLMYGESAGGTGFDLRGLAAADYEALSVDSVTGRRWIQYVKIESVDVDNINTPEIDAVADVSACGDYKHPYPVGDMNFDCRVDLGDFALLAADWLSTSSDSELALLAANWLTCSWDCE
jgi:hypothetical protein